ncbi:GGDEF domain-containing protein [Mycobacterium paragordonae]|jgi:diguanylate cyclase (GGDEF)-like protein|nr:GGDEF domain-containing protein [Mycobacterium paragordonae]
MLSAGGWSVVQPNPTLAALACTALAVTGGYIALFHNLRLLVLNSLVAMVAATDSMLRLAGASDSTAAVTAFWLICFPNFSVPLIIWGMSQAVESYVQRAQQDPLTGLLNRRAFAEAVAARLVNHPAAHTCLAVMMVDLDNFKQINDTHGHAAGDRLLQAVAELLRDQSPPEAIICRAGGEEFLLAATCTPDGVAALAPPLCRSIAEHPSGITASIGTASADLGSLGAPGGGASLDELIAAADRAMYAAKRRGGNQACDFG